MKIVGGKHEYAAYWVCHLIWSCLPIWCDFTYIEKRISTDSFSFFAHKDFLLIFSFLLFSEKKLSSTRRKALADSTNTSYLLACIKISAWLINISQQSGLLTKWPLYLSVRARLPQVIREKKELKITIAK